MDEPDADPGELARSLLTIRRVNRLLGGTSAVLNHLKRWSRNWNPAQPVTIADIATGSADIPDAILQHFTPRGYTLHILGIDLHPTTLAIARQWTSHLPPTALTLLQADALHLPLPDRSVDYALCSMFLHHLSHDQALNVIAEMLRVARRGIIVNDLLRNLPAKLFIHAATLNAPRMDKHDARVSVAKAWTKPEVLSWKATLNAPWLAYHRHLFSRFTLAGERPR